MFGQPLSHIVDTSLVLSLAPTSGDRWYSGNKCLYRAGRAIWKKANEWVCQKYKDKKCNYFFKSEMFFPTNAIQYKNTHLFNCLLEWSYDASYILFL